MIPLVSDDLLQAATLLGDPLQEVFTNGYLLPFHDQAFRIVYTRMLNEGMPRVKKIVYGTLPAYTNVLYPSQFGIADFGQLVMNGLQERAASTAVAITGATSPAAPNPIVLSAPGHTFGNNADVVVSGIVNYPGANGRFFVGVSGNNLTLNGSLSDGTYTSGGIASTSATLFGVINEDENLEQRTPTAELQVFAQRDGAFRFTGATTDRQLQITYLSSGAAPQSGSVGLDNSKDVLSTLTAALAAPTQDMPSEGARLMQLVMGIPNTAQKGLLQDFITPMAKAQQRVTATRPRFRPKRFNSDYFIPA